MQIIDVANLTIGRSFPEPLFHSTGRKLLAAKTELTQLHLDALIRSGIKQVFRAHTANSVLEFTNTPAKLISVASLVLGTTAETDFLTPDGVVIIQQNEQVEEHHIAALRDSGVDFVLSRPVADVDKICTTLQDLARVVTTRIENSMQRGEYMRAPESLDPFIKSINFPATTKILDPNAIQLLRRRLASRLQPVYGLLETGKIPNHQSLLEITAELLDWMRSEPRQFSQLALMSAGREDYLPDHAISMAVLSMAIAAHMRLSLEMVKEVILGALLCDVGMLALPKRIRCSAGALTEEERERVRQHPVYTLSMMEQLPGLSPIPRLMGFQHHERMNGTGYPKATPAASISDFARIVAAADVFAAIANPRSYKASKLPHVAMEELIHMTTKGLLDPRVIKALLAAIGLFPVGSYVLLSNDMMALVVGANAAKIDRPLVRPLGAGGTTASGPLVDLASAHYNHIKVVRGVAARSTVVEPAAVAS